MSNSSQEKKTTLSELFLDQLKDIHWAEEKLTSVLPKMQQAATSPKLAEAFSEHLEETKYHVSRLKQAFEMLDEKFETKKCEAMAGIVKEGEELISETKQGTEVRDVALIMAAQKVEHYEIATYGSLITIARLLDYSTVADLLKETLKEEKEADEKLTKIAESSVNKQAAVE